jgi:UDP-2,3-diacylglucosamine hydrolase
MQQLPTPCWVVSDVHLGVAPPDIERALLELLARARESARSLIINGDLFEFWFEWKHVMPRTGFRAVAALAEAREAGLPVLFVAGNHDCWGGDALVRDAGVTYHEGTWRGSIGSWTTRIDHGDGLRDVEDRRYRALRAVLRHQASRWLFRILHPDLGVRLAFASSHTSRTTRARDGGAGLRAVAMRALAAEDHLDLLIQGHSHVAALERAEGGGVFANAGGWLMDPTFLVINEEAIELRRWDGSSEGHRLDTLDRRTKKSLAQP